MKGRLSKAEGSPWTRADHPRTPMPFSHQPTVTSLFCLAAGGEQRQESCVRGLMDFRAHQQMSWFSGAPWRQWSWPPWPPSSALALQDICAPWQVGIGVGLEKGWRLIFFCQPDKRQVKVTTELNYETKTILLLGTCIGELSFSSAACWKIKNSKQRGKQMVQRRKQQQKDNLEELK